VAGVPAAIVAGVLASPPPAGALAAELAGLAGSRDAAVADAGPWLRAAGRALATDPRGAG
jgi:hypothetical protein